VTVNYRTTDISLSTSTAETPDWLWTGRHHLLSVLLAVHGFPSVLLLSVALQCPVQVQLDATARHQTTLAVDWRYQPPRLQAATHGVPWDMCWETTVVGTTVRGGIRPLPFKLVVGLRVGTLVKLNVS
jgi:hypothetical protein